VLEPSRILCPGNTAGGQVADVGVMVVGLPLPPSDPLHCAGM